MYPRPEGEKEKRGSERGGRPWSVFRRDRLCTFPYSFLGLLLNVCRFPPSSLSPSSPSFLLLLLLFCCARRGQVRTQTVFGIWVGGGRGDATVVVAAEKHTPKSPRVYRSRAHETPPLPNLLETRKRRAAACT